MPWTRATRTQVSFYPSGLCAVGTSLRRSWVKVRIRCYDRAYSLACRASGPSASYVVDGQADMVPMGRTFARICEINAAVKKGIEGELPFFVEVEAVLQSFADLSI